MKIAQATFKMKTYPEALEAGILAHLLGRYSAKKQIKRAEKEAKKFKDEEAIPTAYDEALKFFMAQGVISADEFKKLEKSMRKYSFTLAKLENEEIIKGIKRSLDAALEEGKAIADWMEEIDAMFDAIGITRLSPHYLELVFKNNSFAAMAEGKHALFDEADEDEFPLMERIEIMDERTRPEHRKLNGFRAPKNDPIWQKLRGPIAHGCRGTERLVHIDEGLEASNWRPRLSGRGFEFIN